MPTVSIIGTASNKEGFFSFEVFEKMVLEARRIITKEFKLNCLNVTLVSGGASWGDHVAVQLFLSRSFAGLEIYFPCVWNFEQCVHEDKGSSDWRSNPGRTSNTYHEEFSRLMNRNTQKDFRTSIDEDTCEFYFLKGFHARNACVAQSDYVIAFTGFDEISKHKGGTKHTWDLCKGIKHHVNVNKL